MYEFAGTKHNQSHQDTPSQIHQLYNVPFNQYPTVLLHPIHLQQLCISIKTDRPDNDILNNHIWHQIVQQNLPWTNAAIFI